jgi:phage-related protein
LELIALARSTAAWIANTAAAIGNGIAVAASAVAGAAVATAAWIANTAAIVANGIAMVAQGIAMASVKVATIAWTAAQWLLNVALTANPVGLIIAGIAALIGVIILIATKTTWFQTIWRVVWGAIQAAAQAVASWFMGTIVPSFQRAFAQLQGALSAIGSFFRAVWNGIRAATQAVWSFIVGYVRGQINAVRGAIAAIGAVVGIVRNAFNNARNAVQTAIGNIISLVRSLPGRVAGALGNLGSLLFERGRALVQGFIRGIGSMIGAVADRARSVVKAVTDFLPGSPAKRGPLSGKGYALLRARRMMADFAQGIDDGSRRPAAAMLGAVVPVSRAIAPSGSTTKSGVSSTPPVATAIGGTRTYALQIAGRPLAEFVVDAVSGAPIAVSKAANEGSRRTAWAGSGR